jgi:hypothetical protein
MHLQTRAFVSETSYLDCTTLRCAESEKENKMKHTQGPWDFDKQYTDDFLEYFRVCDRHGVPIAATPKCDPKTEFGDHRDENEANARLISAAPEMLEFLVKHEASLKNFFDGLEGPFSDSKRDLEGIIKKAKGE